jgi:tight adherence protein C
MSPLAWASVLGPTLGLGLWTLVGIAPRMGARRLADRVAPYIVDVSDEARALVDRPTGDPLAVLASLLAPLLGRAAAAGSVFLSSNDVIALRLSQSGVPSDVATFRRGQLLWAVAGFGCAAAPAVVSLATGVVPGIVAVLPVLGALAGALTREWLLARSARLRVARLEEELPTVLGFLSLSLSAGEGILDALRRVATVGSGEFAAECRLVVAEVGAGVPLARSLQQLADRVRVPALTRTVEQLTGALERGSPLAETLRAHAADARVEGKRRLLESAGRKEVAMLVPLVFLILPLSVAFAILPGLMVLRSGF